MRHANVASRVYQASVLVPIRAARRAAIRVKPPAAVQHLRASPSSLAGQATERTARDVSANCNSVGGVETAVQTAPAVLSVSIPTREARSTLRFQLIPSGKGQAVVVSAVAESSSAQQAGVERGMKLTAISDPIRRDEVWELQDRPSLRYIRDVMRMRNAEFIELCFVADQELLTALEAAEGAISMTGSSSSTPSSSVDSISSLASFSDSGETLAERLQQQYERAQAAANKQTALEQRQQRRKDYMSQVGQRNDNTFVAIMALAFLVPALVILLVAYFTGYLDNLYSNSLTNLR